MTLDLDLSPQGLQQKCEQQIRSLSTIPNQVKGTRNSRKGRKQGKITTTKRKLYKKIV